LHKIRRREFRDQIPEIKDGSDPRVLLPHEMCVGGHAVDCGIGDDDFVDGGKDDGATQKRYQDPIDLPQQLS
jgi:hypothetical protein